MQAIGLKRKSTRIRLSRGDAIFCTINYMLLAVFFLVELYPMVFVVFASVSDPLSVSTGKMLIWPVGFTLEGYGYLLKYNELWIGYSNTLFYTIVGTLINLIVTLPAGYALSRRDVKGKGVLMGIFMFTMYFSGGLIPSYLNIRELGMIDTRWSILLPGALSVYNMIVCRTFFASTIPWELHEAARIDGCSDFKMFLRIILPLSSAITAVMVIYYGVGHWNEYFNAMIYLKNRATYPLQLFLREILMESEFAKQAISSGAMTVEESEYWLKKIDTINMLKYGLIIISTAPMMILFPFLQRFFAKGVMIGSIKG